MSFKFRSLTLRQLKDARTFFHNGSFTEDPGRGAVLQRRRAAGPDGWRRTHALGTIHTPPRAGFSSLGSG